MSDANPKARKLTAAELIAKARLRSSKGAAASPSSPQQDHSNGPYLGSPSQPLESTSQQGGSTSLNVGGAESRSSLGVSSAHGAAAGANAAAAPPPPATYGYNIMLELEEEEDPKAHSELQTSPDMVILESNVTSLDELSVILPSDAPVVEELFAEIKYPNKSSATYEATLLSLISKQTLEKSIQCRGIGVGIFTRRESDIPPLDPPLPLALYSPFSRNRYQKSNFRTGESVQPYIASRISDLMELLKMSIKGNSDDALESALNECSSICRNKSPGGSAHDLFLSKGACAQLVQLLRVRIHERNIIKLLLVVCYDLVVIGPSVLEDGVTALIDAGIIRAIVEVLKSFKIYEDICALAINLLSVFLIEARYITDFLQAGGALALCVAFKEHMNSANFVSLTLTFIVSVIYDETHISLFIEKGLSEILLRLTKTYTGNEKNIQTVVRVLASMALFLPFVDDATADHVARLNMASNVLKLLKANRTYSSSETELLFYSFYKYFLKYGCENNELYKQSDAIILGKMNGSGVENSLVAAGASCLSVLFATPDFKGAVRDWRQLLVKLRNMNPAIEVISIFSAIRNVVINNAAVGDLLHQDGFSFDLIAFFASQSESVSANPQMNAERGLDNILRLSETIRTMSQASSSCKYEFLSQHNVPEILFRSFISLHAINFGTHAKKAGSVLTSLLVAISGLYDAPITKNNSKSYSGLMSHNMLDLIQSNLPVLIASPYISNPEVDVSFFVEALSWLCVVAIQRCPQERADTLSDSYIDFLRMNSLEFDKYCSRSSCIVALSMLVVSSSIDDDRISKLVDVGAFKNICAALHLGAHDAAAVSSICFALHQAFCKSAIAKNDILSRFASSNLLMALVDLLDKHSTSADCVNNISVILGSFVSSSASIRKTLLEQLDSNGVSLSRIIHKCFNSQDREDGYVPLFYLISSLCPLFSDLLGTKEICNILCGCISRYSENREVVSHALLCASALCVRVRPASEVGRKGSFFFALTENNVENQDRLITSGLGEIIMSFRKEYIMDEIMGPLVSASIYILLHSQVSSYARPVQLLASTRSSLVEALVARGFFPLLLDCLKVFTQGSVFVYSAACAIKEIICSYYKDSLSSLPVNEICNCILGVLIKFPSAESISFVACEILESLAIVPAHSNSIISLRLVNQLQRIATDSKSIDLIYAVLSLENAVWKTASNVAFSEEDVQLFIDSFVGNGRNPWIIKACARGFRLISLNSSVNSAVSETLFRSNIYELLREGMLWCASLIKKLDFISRPENEIFVNERFLADGLLQAITELIFAFGQFSGDSRNNVKLTIESPKMVSLVVELFGLIGSVKQSEAYVESLCFLVASLAAIAAIRELFIGSDILLHVLELLKGNLSAALIVSSASQALFAMISPKDSLTVVNQISEHQGFGAIYKALVMHMRVLETAQPLLRLIMRLCKVPVSAKAFGELGLFNLLFTVVDLYPDSDKVVEHVLYLIHALATNAPSIVTPLLLAKKKIHMLMSWCHKFFSSYEVVEAASFVIHLLACVGEEQISMLVERNVCAIIAAGCSGLCRTREGLNAYLKTAEVLLLCSSVNYKVSQELERAGFERNICILLTTWQKSSLMVKDIFGVIIALLRLPHGNHRLLDLLTGHIADMISILLQFKADDDISRLVFQILGVMSLNFSLIGLGHTTAPFAVMEALLSHEQNKDVTIEGIKCIFVMCREYAEADTFVSLGACETLVNILVRFQNDVPAVTAALRAIGKLNLLSESARARLNNFWGVSKVLAVLIVHSNQTDVVKLSIDFISTALINPEERDAAFEMRNIGAISSISEIVERYIDSDIIAKMGASILYELFIFDPAIDDASEVLKGVLIQNELLVRYSSNTDIASIVCKTLTRICMHPSLLDSVVQLDVSELALLVWRTHFESDDVVMSVSEFISELSKSNPVRLKFGESGFFQLAVQTLRSRKDLNASTPLCCSVFRALGAVTLECDFNLAYLPISGVFKLISESIQSIDNPSILRAAMDLLLVIVTNPAHNSRFIEDEGICGHLSSTLFNLSNKPQDGDLKDLCTLLLSVVLYLLDHEKCLLLLWQAGLTKALDVLLASTTDCKLYAQTSRILRALLEGNSHNVEQRAAEMKNIELCKKLADFAPNFVKDCSTSLEDLFFVLCALSTHHEQNVEVLLHSQLIPIVMVAAKDPQTSEVQPDGFGNAQLNAIFCDLVRAMMIVPRASSIVRNSGGCALIKNFICQLVETKEEDSLEHAIQAFLSVCRENVVNQQAFIDLGIASYLLQCIDAWVSREVVVLKALSGLNCLCDCGVASRDLQRRAVTSLRHSGAYESLLNCCKRFSNDSLILAECCKLIKNFSIEAEMVGSLGSTGGCDVLIQSFNRHRTSPDLNLLEAAALASSAIAVVPSNTILLGGDIVTGALVQFLISISSRPSSNESDENIDYYRVAGVVIDTIGALCLENVTNLHIFAELNVLDALTDIILRSDSNLEVTVCKLAKIFVADSHLLPIFMNAKFVMAILSVFEDLADRESEASQEPVLEIAKTLHLMVDGRRNVAEWLASIGGCKVLIDVALVFADNIVIFSEIDAILRAVLLLHPEVKSTLESHPRWVDFEAVESQNIASNVIQMRSRSRSGDSDLFSSKKNAQDDLEWVKSAVLVLIDSMKEDDMKVSSVLVSCCALNRVAATSPSYVTVLLDLGCARILADLLGKHMNASADVVLNILQFFCIVCESHPEKAALMWQERCCELVLQAFKSYESNLTISIAVATLIHRLGLTDEMIASLIEIGSVETLSVMIKSGLDVFCSVQLIGACCKAIFRLIKNRATIRKTFVANGTCDIVAKALSTYMKDENPALVDIVWVVALFCRCGDPAQTDAESIESIQILTEHRADSNLVYVLSRFGSNAAVAEALGAAITNICFSESIIDAVGIAGVSPLLCNCLEYHLQLNNMPVIEALLSASAVISKAGVNAEALVHHKLLEVLVEVMSSQKEPTNFNPSLIRYACTCCINLAAGRNHVCAIFVGLGICDVVPVLLQLVSDRSTFEDIRRSIVIFIKIICVGDSAGCLQFFKNTEVIKLLFFLLTAQISDPTFVYPLCGTFRLLSSIPGVASQLIDVGFPSRVPVLLEKHLVRNDIIEEVIVTVFNIIHEDIKHNAWFSTDSFVSTFVACLKFYSEVPSVLNPLLQLTALLAKNPTASDGLKRSGALELISSQVKALGCASSLMLQYCVAISELSQNAENAKVFCSMEVFECICDVFIANGDDAVCSQFSSLCISLLHPYVDSADEKRKSVVGLCETCVHCLKMHQESPGTVSSVCQLVKCLADRDQIRKLLGSQQICPLLVACLESYREYPSVNLHVLKAIRAVALKNDDNKIAFGELMIANAVMEAATFNWTEVNVLEDVFLCITTLTFGNAINNSAFGMYNACELVLKAVNEYASKHSSIAASGCQALFCLSKGAGNYDRLDVCGGVDIVAGVLDVYMDNEKIVRHACNALAALAQSDRTNALMSTAEASSADSFKRSKRVCGLIARVMGVHVSNPIVVRSIVSATNAMLVGATNAELFADYGACEFLEKALKLDQTVQASVFHIFDTMNKLCLSRKAAVVYSNTHTFVQIVDALKHHNTHLEVQVIGFQLVLSILRHVSVSSCSIIVEPTVANLKKFGTDEMLLALCCRCSNLVFEQNVGNAEHFVSLGGVLPTLESLQQLLNSKTQNLKLLSIVFKCLEVLCKSTKKLASFPLQKTSELVLQSFGLYTFESSIISSVCLFLDALLLGVGAEFKAEFGRIGMMNNLLKLLENHKHDAQASEAISRVINSLCIRNAENLRSFFDLDGGRTVSELVQVNSDSVAICGVVFSLMTMVLSISRDFINLLGEINVRNTCFSLLSGNMQDADFVFTSVTLLRTMYQIEYQRDGELIASIKGETELLVQILSQFKDRSDISMETCGAISFLAANMYASQELHDCGACQAIGSTLHNAVLRGDTKVIHPSLVAVAVMANKCLDNQSAFSNNDDVRSAIAKCISINDGKTTTERLAMNCIVAICGEYKGVEADKMKLDKMLNSGLNECAYFTLERRLTVVESVDSCCAALACLARSSHCQDRLIRLGTCKLVVKVMKDSRNLTVLADCCSILWNFAHLPEGHRQVNSLNATDILSGIMDISTSDARLSLESSRLITILSRNHTEIAKKFLALAVPKHLCVMLDSHANQPEVLIEVLLAMIALCEANEANMQFFFNESIGKSIVALEISHIDNIRIVAAAFNLLRLIVTQSMELVHFLGPQIDDALNLTFLMYRNDPDCIINVLQFLSGLEKSDVILSSGICGNVIELLNFYMDRGAIVSAVCEVVARLGMRSSEMRTSFNISGAPAAFMNILQLDVSVSEYALQICFAMLFLSSDVSTNRWLVDAGCGQLANQIVELHSGDSNILHQACRAIILLVEFDARLKEQLEQNGICPKLLEATKRYVKIRSLYVLLIETIETIVVRNEAYCAHFSDSAFLVLVLQQFQRAQLESLKVTADLRLIAALSFLPKNSAALGKAGACESILKELANESADDSVVLFGLEALSVLTDNSPMNAEFLVKRRAIDLVMAILNRRYEKPDENESILVHGIKFLYNLAPVLNAKHILLSSDIVLVIVSLLCNSAENVLPERNNRLLATATDLITVIAADEPMRLKLSESGTLELLLLTAQRILPDISLVHGVFKAVFSLVRSSETNVHTFVEECGMAILSDAFDAHPADAPLLTILCWILYNVLKYTPGEDIQVLLCEYSFGQKLVLSFVHHFAIESFSEAVCFAIESMARRSKALQESVSLPEIVGVLKKTCGSARGSKNERLMTIALDTCTALATENMMKQQEFLRLGFCEVADKLTEILTSHTILISLLRLISTLCRCGASPESISLTALARFSRTGVVNVVVKHMNDFLSNAEVVRCGCIAITNLSLNAAMKLAFIRANTCAMLLRAFKPTLLNEAATVALSTATVDLIDNESRDSMVAQGIVDQLVMVLHKYPDNAAIVDCVNRSVPAFCISKEIKKLFAQRGICSMISRAITKHVASAKLCVSGFNAVVVLSEECPENRILLGAAGGCEAIIGAIRHHASETAVARAGSRALSVLMEGNFANQKRVADVGGKSLILSETTAGTETTEQSYGTE